MYECMYVMYVRMYVCMYQAVQMLVGALIVLNFMLAIFEAETRKQVILTVRYFLRSLKI